MENNETTTEATVEATEVEETTTTESTLAPNEKTMGMLCHLLGFVGIFGIPFGSILGPLVIWLIKKEGMPFVDKCGKAALNFQISFAIYGVVSALLCMIFIGFLILPVLIILWIVLVIKASMAANEGELYEYPLTIQFLK